MTSPFSPPVLGRESLGADAPDLRIKNLGSVGVRCLINGEAFVES